VSATPAPPLLLASTSPQRRAILEQLGLPFDVVAPVYEEHDPPGADAHELVQVHARGKARSVAREAGDRPVLGVDTAVALDGDVFGKPEGEGDAERMLERLHDIRLSEAHHGPPGDRRFEITPTYILAGVEALHLEFEPA
jgi:septum formation protein